MNILFLTNDLYPYLNANSEIAYRVAHEISKYEDCHVSILGFNRSVDTVFPDPFEEIETIRMETVTDYFRIVISTPQTVKRVAKLFIHPKSFRCYLRARMGDKNWLVKEYQSEILRIVRSKKIDCIIAFSAPRDTLLAVSGLNLSIPLVAYKLDPWSTHYQFAEIQSEREREERVDAKMDRIICTDLIKNDYLCYADEKTMNKLTTVEFPNILDYEQQERISEFDDGKIHCVFAGGLYKDIREPDYTVKLFEALTDKNIVLHIFGYQAGGTLLPEPLPPNVIYHGMVSCDEAMRYMQSADILVNIGNTVLNQMPSKILSYISLGKPIVNIVKSVNCPTLPYMEKYPLALNILETNELRGNDRSMLAEFIHRNVGKRIPFETIKKLYEQCTPEYVGRRVCEIVCEAIQSK